MGPKSAKRNRYKRAEAPQRSLWKPALRAVGKAFLTAFGLVCASLLLVFGHDALLQNHFFDAKRISVAGNQRLTDQQVLAQAGLKTGVNILSVNLSLARNRIEAHPWIADAELHREWPDGIAVRIREEQPVAVVVIDKAWLVNAEGRLFKEAAAGDAVGLIVVEGLSYLDVPAAGTQAGVAFKAVMDILELGRRPDAPLPLAMIKRIEVDREIGLTVSAFDGPKTIRLGYGDYGVKIDRLERLIGYLKASGRFDEFAAIDLNSPERAVAVPVSAPPPEAEEKEV